MHEMDMHYSDGLSDVGSIDGSYMGGMSMGVISMGGMSMGSMSTMSDMSSMSATHYMGGMSMGNGMMGMNGMSGGMDYMGGYGNMRMAQRTRMPQDTGRSPVASLEAERQWLLLLLKLRSFPLDWRSGDEAGRRLDALGKEAGRRDNLGSQSLRHQLNPMCWMRTHGGLTSLLFGLDLGFGGWMSLGGCPRTRNKNRRFTQATNPNHQPAWQPCQNGGPVQGYIPKQPALGPGSSKSAGIACPWSICCDKHSWICGHTASESNTVDIGISVAGRQIHCEANSAEAEQFAVTGFLVAHRFRDQAPISLARLILIRCGSRIYMQLAPPCASGCPPMAVWESFGLRVTSGLSKILLPSAFSRTLPTQKMSIELNMPE